MANSEKVKSPCIRQCCLDQQDICLGCYRSLQEILDWAAGSDDEKRAVLARTAVRQTARGERNKVLKTCL
ncbi:DUF1289 domain-containing protein [Neptunomonas sp.]|uniref:DUF1289 domain-containing protein n=1 Tax=Neptunomonas sp. TaxID=1971898 RepID=UPI00356170AD